MRIKDIFEAYPELCPPDDPHDLVRWCFKNALDENGKIKQKRQNFERDFLRTTLGISSLRQLDDREAQLLAGAALEDPDVWDDAVFAFRYHVSQQLSLPRPLVEFAALALANGRPKRAGRHKGDQAARNGYVRMAADLLRIRGVQEGKNATTGDIITIQSVICDVLNEIGESLDNDAVRKIIAKEPDEYEKFLIQTAYARARHLLY